MKSLFAVPMLLLAGLLIAGLVPDQAQAARLGGARSFGVQRPVAPSPQKIAPAPQGTPQAAPQSQTPQGAAAQRHGSRWLGPLAGLAAGLGLGWLLSQGGFGALMAAVLIGLLACLAVFALLRLFLGPRAADARPIRYGDLHEETVAAPPSRVPGEAPGRVRAQAVMPAPPIPADFDSAAFIRQAKLNFIRLQEANDRGDLNALREVTTDTMFDSILADLRPHRPAQHTDVVNLNANLLEVATEGDKHWASVRFHGTIREDDGVAAAFEEVWHLQKPVSGNSGWVLAGIQQVS